MVMMTISGYRLDNNLVTTCLQISNNLRVFKCVHCSSLDANDGGDNLRIRKVIIKQWKHVS
jgi:hypothetical protein